MNKKFRNATKLTSFIKLYDLMHSLQDLMPYPPEGLPIHSVCQIYVYIFGGFTRCSTGNHSKFGKKKQKTNIKKKVITFARTPNRCSTWHEHRRAGKMADCLQCLFHRRLNFAMSPGLLWFKLQLFCG